jgi:adenylate cyclase class 2
MLEIELKVRVENVDTVRDRLHLLSAVHGTDTLEHDVYFNAPHRNFARTDEAIRVRYSQGTCTLTYKGPKNRNFAVKAREELNTGVESGPVLEQILMRLGFTRSADVRKRREYYTFRGASVALDQVEGLGSFVEIEVVTEETGSSASDLIGRLAGDLGLSGEPILLSYLELLQAARGDPGSSPSQETGRPDRKKPS